MKGHLDLPRADVPVKPGSVVVSGWVLHEEARELGVVVTVNGVPYGGAAVSLPRPDVGVRHPDSPSALHSGWSTVVQLPDLPGDDVHLEVFVVLPGQPGQRRGRQMIRFAQRMVPVSRRGGAYGGCFVETGAVAVGHSRVMGLAEAPGGVARVEVFCDGRSAGFARTQLPGNFEDNHQGPESELALFELSVPFPDVDRASLTATAHAVDGTRVDLRPLVVDVEPPEPASWTEERLEVVRGRSRARLDAQRAARGTSSSAVDPSQPAGPSVLVVTHDLGLGGGQLYLQELIVRLQRRGVRCAVASPRGGPLLDECESLGMPVVVTGVTDPHDPEAYEAQVLQIASFGIEHGCEVALANTMSAFPGVDAALRLDLPVVWAIHESFPLQQFWAEAFAPPVPSYVAARAEDSLRRASRLVFEAAATRDLYTPWTAPGAGVVVMYGVDVREIDAYRAEHDRAVLREELGFRPDTLVLLCMGTVEPRKAQIAIALAFSRSEALRGRDVVLVLVGAKAGTPYVTALEAMLADLEETRVLVEPVQPTTYRWYHAADVLVCGSDVESLPRSMLEAMAFERPVASTAVFGIPDLVVDGESGFLCEPRDLLALGEMLDRVAACSPSRLAEMGRAAREVVTTTHDPSVYESWYHDELVARAGARRATVAGG